ncbi:MAG TPA: ATP synthase F1 subunit epsilon [Bacteroidetes bacterium]|nr:ATP synthase F1 subunit epsilon [Bacteroidota bacterium]
MYLEIITPEKKVFTGEVRLIQVPGTKGSFEILHNHAPIISTLQEGTIRYITNEGQEKTVELNGGVIEAKNNHITILGEFT